MHGGLLAPDGKYYIVTPDWKAGMSLFVYDPDTNLLEDRGILVLIRIHPADAEVEILGALACCVTSLRQQPRKSSARQRRRRARGRPRSQSLGVRRGVR